MNSSTFDRPAAAVSRAWSRRLIGLLRNQKTAFVLVGCVNTAVGMALFLIADRTIGVRVDELAGRTAGSLVTLVASHIGAVLIAFMLHRRFVFRVRGNALQDLVRFESVYIVGLVVNAIALPIAVRGGAPRVLAQFVILGVIAVGSYLGHKHFSFRRLSAPVPPA